ncbi:MAG: DUF433 domain-containing protein [candidate division KSB1 bacterium]
MNMHNNGRKTKLVRECYGGEIYEYHSLGKHIVMAPGVCGGRPTFKYTRLEVSMILSLLGAGQTIEEVVQAYSLSRLSSEAVHEAIGLANQALVKNTKKLVPV